MARAGKRWVALLPPMLLLLSSAGLSLALDSGVRPSSSRSAELSIVFRHGRLSVHAGGVPWPEVLAELSRQTGMELHIAPAPDGTATVHFDDLPLERGLRQLFGPDAHFVLGFDTRGHALPREAWVVTGPSRRSTSGAAPTTSVPEPAPHRPPADERGQSPEERALAGRLAEVRGVTDSAGAPALLSALDDGRAAVRQTATEILGDLGEESSTEALKRLAGTDPDVEVRQAAVAALARIGSRAALAALSDALRGSDLAVRRHAVAAIAGIDDERKVPLLRVALGNDDDEVRQVAREALETFAREAFEREEESPARRDPRGAAGASPPPRGAAPRAK